MSKLDDVSWHFGAEGFPEGAPEEDAATHIGFFVTWLIRNDHWGDFFGVGTPSKVAAVKDGILSGRSFLLEVCDGKLITEMLKTHVVPFAQKYYNEQYLDDYCEQFLKDLPPEHPVYSVEDSATNYQRIARIIDQRYAENVARAGRSK